ncbi:MAG: site-2 protease family protein, partial [Gemmatimonadetes bacterium]|nr:site-2 protease family protein [Gemmatimonadota bacterium]
VLWWGYRSSIRIPGAVDGPSIVSLAGTPILLGESLLTHWLRDAVVDGTGAVVLSPMAFAGWVGMFVTALNLLPLSQLDGGHVLFGLAGRRQAAISFVAALVLLWLGRHAPVWWIWAALTFVIGGGRWAHPSVVLPERPVLRAGRVIGYACILVLFLTFVPVPFAG